MADNRRMCPNCRAFITTSDKVCPYCGERTGPTYVQRNPGDFALGGLIPQAHFTTVLILMINAGFYIATELLANKYGGGNRGETIALWALGGKFWEAVVQEHQWWRLVTAGFLHGGLIHILMNSWVLYDLGAQVEQVFETPRFLVIYLLSTVGGFYFSLRMSHAPSIGASAGITGLIGAMIAFGVLNRSSLGTAIRNFYLRWVVYILAMGLFPGFRTDNWAHIGGLLAGFAVGYVAGTPIRSTHTRETFWRGAAALCVVITAFCFFEVFRNFPSPDQLR